VTLQARTIQDDDPRPHSDSTRDPGLPEPDPGVGELASAADGMPAVLLGHVTPQVAAEVESFCRSVAELLEAWGRATSAGK